MCPTTSNKVMMTYSAQAKKRNALSRLIRRRRPTSKQSRLVASSLSLVLFTFLALVFFCPVVLPANAEEITAKDKPIGPVIGIGQSALSQTSCIILTLALLFRPRYNVRDTISLSIDIMRTFLSSPFSQVFLCRVCTAAISGPALTDGCSRPCILIQHPKEWSSRDHSKRPRPPHNPFMGRLH
jgi:hypothetical protein